MCALWRSASVRYRQRRGQMHGSTNTLARRHALQLAQRERHRKEHDNLTIEQGEYRKDGVVAGGAGEVVKGGTGLAAPLNAQLVFLTHSLTQVTLLDQA
jgi:hypothetical protein